MNLFADIQALVLDCLQNMVTAGELPEGLALDNVTVAPPRDAAYGDMTTNAAMVLAKPTSMKPRDIAQTLAAHLIKDARITHAAVAGPGFVNLRLAASVWQGVIAAALSKGIDFGRATLGQGKRVHVAYVSANATGLLHVGDLRGAVCGDALASLLEFAGHDVTREYFINGSRGQGDTLARSVYLRYLEAQGQEVAFPDGTYSGDYLIAAGEALKEKVGDAYLGKGEQVWLRDVQAFAIDAMGDLIRADLKSLGVEMDVFCSEKSICSSGGIEAAINDLNDKGLIYDGTLAPPEGNEADDGEPRVQKLFRATVHGDDEDRLIKKSDGSWADFAADIAYHHDKLQRGFDLLIDVMRADHVGHAKRMTAAVSALSEGQVPLDIMPTQLVKLFKDGQEVKKPNRAGTFASLRDVVDQVGPDVTRFVMFTRKHDTTLDFDVDKVMEQSRENPVFYVQYAHARGVSVLRKAGEAGISVDDETLQSADLSLLDHEAELGLAAKLAEWPRLVETAARRNEPHRVAIYLDELAGTFHALWNKGHDLPSLRFVQDDPKVTTAKIALARATSVVIAAGLGILGVTPAQEMR
ncbi:arginine--tRNA ligase [uncultured Roseobacter sp.]|uniref:arginine--tRNA ligase n=1 Tax=uncultured Roseobacter sp. TaxID=114847 RepID=UPI002626BAAC|nr:arginine--tRNA ligase [uncultured Roseobacter sp.]